MKTAVQVPIKAKSSQRVPNKNFRDLQGKPLCHWLLDELVELPSTYDIFIDSEDACVFSQLQEDRYGRFDHHQRNDWFASDEANGNHLLHQFALAHPDYEIYVQVFVTAVTLKRHVIEEAVETFKKKAGTHDSLFLATEDTGWIWFEDRAINYDPTRPHGLARSQDATYLKETTGLYAITREALLRTGCRLGMNPLPYLVEKEFAFDVDTMSDLEEAEKILANKHG